MTVRYFVARIDEASPVGYSAGWGVIRHETGEPGKFVSRIFPREQDAQAHAQRLMMQEARTAHGASRSEDYLPH
jgi:hypothetical protein